jgi:hypothetical protein
LPWTKVLVWWPRTKAYSAAIRASTGLAPYQSLPMTGYSSRVSAVRPNHRRAIAGLLLAIAITALLGLALPTAVTMPAGGGAAPGGEAVTPVTSGLPMSGIGLVATTAPQTTVHSLTFSETWHGKALHGPKAPDVLVLPSPPSGSWWEITKIQLTAHCPQQKTFDQSSFLFSRFVQNPTKYPGLADPNLDVLAHVELNKGKTGTFIGAGGLGKSPNPQWDWTRFDQPITLNSEVQIVLGSSLGIGNSVTVTVDYKSLGTGTTVVEYAHPHLDGKTETFELGPVPSGKKWYLENAFASIDAGSGGGGRQISIHLEPSGRLLLRGTDYPRGVLVRNTGGYSTVQTGPALNQYGTETAWASDVWISGSEYIVVSFTGESSDQAMYALGFTQVAA